ncbi:hypothetical protein MVEG_11621 [Podila verticillata NRRL 6337]|uniref:Uncharacterized protein n=1 Tax=Podila verticillata NRRL 6337 TaxID=1069443 RepID=A0A086TKD5_9FUNG|nr:hypothetical protein MVEG_11621 [Podila verticillata NRRL 6337]
MMWPASGIPMCSMPTWSFMEPATGWKPSRTPARWSSRPLPRLLVPSPRQPRMIQRISRLLRLPFPYHHQLFKADQWSSRSLPKLPFPFRLQSFEKAASAFRAGKKKRFLCSFFFFFFFFFFLLLCEQTLLSL